jgi:hypothetical protein
VVIIFHSAAPDVVVNTRNDNIDAWISLRAVQRSMTTPLVVVARSFIGRRAKTPKRDTVASLGNDRVQRGGWPHSQTGTATGYVRAARVQLCG